MGWQGERGALEGKGSTESLGWQAWCLRGASTAGKTKTWETLVREKLMAADQPLSNLVAQARDPGIKSEPSVSPKLACGYLDASLLRMRDFSILFYFCSSQVAERIASEEIATLTKAISSLDGFSL